jgi:very-short-patch-repair endonuclease
MYNRDEDGKVVVTCKKHGDFKILPTNFYKGVGCPICAESSLEGEFRRFLEENNINYEYQCNKKRFKWLGKQRIDFYLPDYNIAIECQGGQHFYPSDKFDGEEGFRKTLILDSLKREKCKQNGIKLLYYANYNNIKFPYEVFTNKEKILKGINGN